MYKLLYPSISVRTAPPVSVRSGLGLVLVLVLRFCALKLICSIGMYWSRCALFRISAAGFVSVKLLTIHTTAVCIASFVAECVYGNQSSPFLTV